MVEPVEPKPPLGRIPLIAVADDEERELPQDWVYAYPRRPDGPELVVMPLVESDDHSELWYTDWQAIHAAGLRWPAVYPTLADNSRKILRP
jgi:hypothetical protein